MATTIKAGKTSERPHSASPAMTIKADKQIYNQATRTIIHSVLTPYADFLTLHPKLKKWSEPALDQMVIPAVMPDNAQLWVKIMSKSNEFRY